jgi:hypothetical protein
LLNANVATDERDRIALNEDVPGALTGARRIGKYRAEKLRGSATN